MTSKQPIRTRYLGHVTGISANQGPVFPDSVERKVLFLEEDNKLYMAHYCKLVQSRKLHSPQLGDLTSYLEPENWGTLVKENEIDTIGARVVLFGGGVTAQGESTCAGKGQEPTEPSKQPIRTRCLGHVTGYQPIRDQYFLIRSVPGTSRYNFLTVT
eukprot:sb/3473068/